MPIDDYAEQPFVKKNKQFDLIAKICVERSNQRTEAIVPRTVTKFATHNEDKKEELSYVFCPKQLQP